MAADWTLKVEDFGRIAAAEVTVKPLTVLVGRNNSGKSYLASLIWGLHHGGLRTPFGQDTGCDAIIDGWLKRAEASGEQWTAWTEHERDAMQKAWPAFVDASVDGFCRHLFDVDDIRPAKLVLAGPDLARTWHAEYRPRRLVGFSTSPDIPEQGESQPESLADAPRWFQTTLSVQRGGWEERGVVSFLAGFAGRALDSTYGFNDPIYLPASRTGFSLFLPLVKEALFDRLLTQVQRASGGGSALTLPYVHLLQALAAGFHQEAGPYADEAARLERDCLDGIITIQAPFKVANYRFLPDGCSEPIGMQHSSALVTELMPLIIALRYAQHLPFLVLEEPEAHLHPKLQRAITRCLARLVRRGVRVLITTHSATVAQQINNLIKLESLDPEQRQRFGYDADEHLRLDEVAMHELVFRDDGRTVSVAAEATPAGFGLPTFNDALYEFARETLDLNAIIEPDEAEDAE